MPRVLELVSDLLLCLRFFSRLPIPVFAAEPAPHDLARLAKAVRMVPLAGAILGGLAALVLTEAAARGLSPQLAAALAIGSLVILSGALHEDGLADCADGLAGRTKESRLEIMRDSRIGSYGAIAIMLGLTLRIEALAAIVTTSATLAALTLIAAAAVSRTAALVPAFLLPPAREDGAGHAAGRPEAQALAIAIGVMVLVALVPVSAGADPRVPVLAVAAALGVTLAGTGLAYRLIGGHSGDVAGAVQQLAELAFLLVIAAR